METTNYILKSSVLKLKSSVALQDFCHIESILPISVAACHLESIQNV